MRATWTRRARLRGELAPARATGPALIHLISTFGRPAPNCFKIVAARSRSSAARYGRPTVSWRALTPANHISGRLSAAKLAYIRFPIGKHAIELMNINAT